MKNKKRIDFEDFINHDYFNHGLDYEISIPESIDGLAYFTLIELLNKEYQDKINHELKKYRKLIDLRIKNRSQIIDLVGKKTYDRLRKHVVESRQNNLNANPTEIGKAYDRSYFEKLDKYNKDSQQKAYDILKDSGTKVDSLIKSFENFNEQAMKISIPKDKFPVSQVENLEDTHGSEGRAVEIFARPITFRRPYDVGGGTRHYHVSRHKRTIWEWNDGYFTSQFSRGLGDVTSYENWVFARAGDGDDVSTYITNFLGSVVKMDYHGAGKWNIHVKLRCNRTAWNYYIRNNIGFSSCSLQTLCKAYVTVEGKSNGTKVFTETLATPIWYRGINGVPSEYHTWNGHLIPREHDYVRTLNLITTQPILGPFEGQIRVHMDTLTDIHMNDVDTELEVFNKWYLDEIKIVQLF